MTKQDRKKFAQLMSVLGEAFDRDVSDSKVEVYFIGLEDISINDIERAVRNIVQTR